MQKSQERVEKGETMRVPEYLSPSAIALFDEDVSAYYLRYLSDTPPPRDPQTAPMAIGSAFDAYVKSYLHEGLFGKGRDARFAFEAIFEAQVEASQRDWARTNGKYVFHQYQQSGCLADLMLELETAIGEPRFEFEVKGVVNGYREGVSITMDGPVEMGEVTLLGKPDVEFTSKNGVHCILDFKVNGYCSKWNKSPMTHYTKMRSAGLRNHGRHGKCVIKSFGGMEINVACCLEDIETSWARQLAIYGWLTGNPVGSEFVTIIHQIVCSPNKGGGLPAIRCAEHLNLIGASFQHSVFDNACKIWDIVHSDHVFRNMSLSESVERCKVLDSYCYAHPFDSLDQWINDAAKNGGRG